MKYDENGFIVGDSRINDINQDTQSINNNTKQILNYLQGLDIDELGVTSSAKIDDVVIDEPKLKKTVEIKPKSSKNNDRPSYQAKLAKTAVSSNHSVSQRHSVQATKHIVAKQQELKREQHYDNLTDKHQLEKRRILREMVHQEPSTDNAFPNPLGGMLPTIVQPRKAKSARPVTHSTKQIQMPKSTLIATAIAPQAKYLSDEASQAWQSSVNGLNPVFGKMWDFLGNSFKGMVQSMDNISSYFGFSLSGAFKNVKDIFKTALLSIPFLGSLAHLATNDSSDYSSSMGGVGYGGMTAGASGVSTYKDMASVNNTKYDSLILKIAQEEGVPANYIKAIMHTESRYNPNAVSPVGAMGLMQIMPNSVKDLAQRSNYRITNIYDPEQNVRGGAKHIKQTIKDLQYKGVIQGEFDWNNTRHLDLLSSAYNAGAGTVSKAVKNGKMPTSHENINYRRDVLAKLNNNLAGKTASANPQATQATSKTQQAQQRLGAYYVGDSLAVGAGGLGGKGIQGQAVQGLNPSQVLQNIQNLGGKLNGQNVVLSSGLSNNVKDIASVEKQLQYLTQTAKANVTLMGVAHQWDSKNGGQLNAQLAQLAKKYGVIFDGGFQAGKDGVHSSSYSISQKQKSLGSIFNMKAHNLAPLPQNSQAMSASRVNIKVDNPTTVGERDFVHRV